MRRLGTFVASVTIVCALLATPSDSHALDLGDADAFGYVAAELYTPFAPSGHGVFLVGGRVLAPNGMKLEVELNTDTLRAGFDRYELDGGWTVGASVVGQYQFAGLLTDHYRNGVLIEAGGISASRVGGSVHAEIEAEDDLYVRLEATANRWYFSRFDSTGSNFVLPPETWVVSPRLRVTYWGYDYDRSFDQMHRPFWRTDGFGAGLSFGIDHRTATRPWGFSTGPRNNADDYSAHVSQWARWGVAFAGRYRVELFEEAGVETGADDLTRRRLGGLNPYVAIIPGAPWASILTSQWLHGGARARVRLGTSMELGPVAAAAIVRDPERIGADAFGTATGFGVEVDWRPAKVWQVDASLGYSPDTGIWDDGPQMAFYLGAGRSF